MPVGIGGPRSSTECHSGADAPARSAPASALRMTWWVPCRSRQMTFRVALETATVGVQNLRDQSAGGLAGVEIARAHEQGGQPPRFTNRQRNG
ncbi:hypothetical protein GCM10010493_70110 [Streptomyces lavendulae subsp. grasserius]